jgi:hypothetical protein
MSGLLVLSLPASESAQTAEQSSSTVIVVHAVVIFVGTYVLIAAEWVHRVAAALIGAALMVVIGATDATPRTPRSTGMSSSYCSA